MAGLTCEQANVNSGYLSIKSTEEAQLRPHFLLVSEYGHSQAIQVEKSIKHEKNLLSISSLHHYGTRNRTRVCTYFTLA